MGNLLRHLPQLDALLSTAAMASLLERYSREEVADALRAALQEVRKGVQAGHMDSLPDFESAGFVSGVMAGIEARRRPNLVAAINATGIIIHTNLGRARLAPEAMAAVQAAGAHASNLELDLATGRRGSRYAHVEALICELTGAEAALVVNNCAAAVLLSLMATAQGRKVIASRGELIEIGGSFRLPDVIQQSGATLKEVGATNKTRASDYAQAIDAETAVLLKSHTSNYQIVGFTHAPQREELASLARETGTILMEDLGSGVLVDLSPYGLNDEPVVSDVLKSGVDVVMFSGDKLLGGPQCGIIAGRADIIVSLKKHPLCRAVRIDKLSLAALEATLRLYRAPHDPFQKVPVLRAISQPVEEIEARARRLAGELTVAGIVDVMCIPSRAYVGGGSLPQQNLESCAVTVIVPHLSPDALAAALRAARPPVIGMIREDRFVMDVRTLIDGDLPGIVEAFRQVALR
ncbi:L-seryl-tRNA selenium transferase [Hyphomonas neptunium ATCC 15444]|uniref:L-seryl-tRNA(Sec) selenium transferase n=2 Tax=Hyphomonas TaxID=85 RepID=SELA_HYPNA|nr:RecName: Full=L-seryl-tRNA(Sec) selenium transferase; AltName: Full=Selenocysteine synthase; Short=Sec synthase; AltName: Full=Selenocysteinyl-tRNA(Sec) synthase [Hyphomonas neptunium ATCC 15444]ABI76187.1 L-seryl-tRNA selenium transferase [Hyphomonas neptunium ATCC 15444]KCZ95273.1 L-seryl-tRNA selenium transferase [Hyphomonas hirschiana VP5]